jgi:phosphatidate cytidylyltransferase
MLKQRVITAVVLLLILLPALFYRDPAPFCLIAMGLIAAGAWEWSRLNGCSQNFSLVSAALCAGACAVMWWADLLLSRLPVLWLLAGSAWVLFGAWSLRGGVVAWSALPRGVRWLVGLVALMLAWLAMAQARVIGINFLLSILVLVWVADIGAYFFGRAFGGRVCQRRLAPAISPGKTWEGVWGGMLCVIGLALLWRWTDQVLTLPVPSFFTQIGQGGIWLVLIAAIFMAAMSVVGDLFESLIKRSAGAKDSSGLLPGHGGVLDRVDALLPTLPLAMMLYSIQAIQ